MMAHDRAVIIDEAPAVAREQTALRTGMEITPRINPVATGRRDWVS